MLRLEAYNVRQIGFTVHGKSIEYYTEINRIWGRDSPIFQQLKEQIESKIISAGSKAN